ncbi:hypothetical protein BV330_00912 [Pseudomonas syringae pv. actinidiae]|nr:hypothetical protein BV339_01018 [Pseudomonas syringae pv. actinidiae]OSN53404.1 hypothetical protein BV345_00951 [Pseudomonas syringae pv. actinidiae]OSN56834.1 hypothetical protein BV346_00887 [Pseudomonas syringae pv. actinidiae]OSR94393.1 hypothetical protein BV330_00912 [Pseudomonas syringae pv. actinidiae]OSR97475.1 hypothetical protein BV331_00998 [Pseudomonas syringae pv. actinidiae]
MNNATSGEGELILQESSFTLCQIGRQLTERQPTAQNPYASPRISENSGSQKGAGSRGDSTSVERSLSRPNNPTLPQPEMRSASSVQPHRRVQGWSTMGIRRAVPSRSNVHRQKQLYRPIAPTGALKPDTPVFDSVPDQNQPSEGNPFRQHFPLDNLQLSGREHGIDPAVYLLAKRFKHHRSPVKSAMPSNGSSAPDANPGSGVH